MKARNKERSLVRELARQVAQIAASPENALVIRRWRDVNGGRRPDRAPVWCRPVTAWNELIPESSLICTDSWLRTVEYGFRQILCKHDIGDDTPVAPCFAVPAVFTTDPDNIWGVDIMRRQAGAGGAWGYAPALKAAADFDRLRLPQHTWDQAETQRRLSRAQELLGDLLPVRLVAEPLLSATLGTAAADLRGLEQIMLDMIVAPELMHRLMGHLRDSVLSALDRLEATGLLTANNHGPMIESDPVGTPGPGGRTTLKNLWCMANSQEFDQVSPAMWEEFCLAYQKPIFARFGAVAYGCCENLTRKITGVLSIPNLRLFVCSAWTSLDAVVERVGTRHTIMWRQKASEVVMASDVSGVARQLGDGAQRLKGCYYQIVLRELETLAGHPDRLHVWTRLAKDAAERHAA